MSISSSILICKQVVQRATIAHLSPMGQGQILFKTSSPKGNNRSPESNVPRSNLISKIWTHLSFNACSCYMKVSKGWLCWGLTSQSTIFQSCRDGAIASWVINQYFRGVKCLAQGHITAAVGLEPRTSRSGVRHSTTEPPRSQVSKGSNQKQRRKSGNIIFPIISLWGYFLRPSRAANSLVGGPIWPKFELIHNIMHVLVTSKFEKDWININRDYVMTSIFSDAQGQLTVVGGQIWPKFELIQDIMHVLITCKFEKDWISSNGEKVVTSTF